ncbi:hypothetical protein VTI74DRAFT_5763 [Chaetomium olivicolor]
MGTGHPPSFQSCFLLKHHFAHSTEGQGRHIHHIARSLEGSEAHPQGIHAWPDVLPSTMFARSRCRLAIRPFTQSIQFRRLSTFRPLLSVDFGGSQGDGSSRHDAVPSEPRVQDPMHQPPVLRTGGSNLSSMTVTVDPAKGTPAELKRAALETLENWCALGPRRGIHTAQQDDGVIVLASRALASWLDDDAFVAHMLQCLGRVSPRWPALTVLTAAVDQVPAYDRRIDDFYSAEGLSVLLGDPRRLLPGVWLTEQAAEGDTTPPSLEIRPPSWFSRSLNVTVPLANTLFANGRPHTLTVSRWETASQEPYLPRVVKRLEKRTQTIALHRHDMGFKETSCTTVQPPLVAVTEPREIISGLGNILRQIKCDSKPCPASAELESEIPLVYEWCKSRANEFLSDTTFGAPVDGYAEGTSSGPIGVWALICPKEYVAEDKLELMSLLRKGAMSLNPTVTEEIGRQAAKSIQKLLYGGCQLRRVLSGGGGWGAKQGLLSLDPQIRLAPDEERDMESFIGSFQGDDSARGPLAPGSYVQFFVEMPYPTQKTWQTPFPRRWDPEEFHKPTTVFGTPATAPNLSSVIPMRTYPGLFGAISSQGIYLSHWKAQSKGQTKIDAQRSYVISSARFTPISRKSPAERPASQQVSHDGIPASGADRVAASAGGRAPWSAENFPKKFNIPQRTGSRPPPRTEHSNQA